LSSNSSDNIREFLRRHQLDDFDLVCTASNVFGKAKPLRKLVRRAHWSAADVFYIGDEVRDVLAARDAGVRSVAVTWGYSARAALVSAEPEFLVDTPEELIDMLRRAAKAPRQAGATTPAAERGS
jgi:phosphoglycolate phosphatase